LANKKITTNMTPYSFRKAKTKQAQYNVAKEEIKTP
jgi:hypothetical protein